MTWKITTVYRTTDFDEAVRIVERMGAERKTKVTENVFEIAAPYRKSGFSGQYKPVIKVYA
ncbi:MAG: hypothetical protein HYX24_07625 [Candidatus Aenigmarchaeota archaeon]|nr:hypothetical protein [Candidatus Aenigmarchaeota archaeon]